MHVAQKFNAEESIHPMVGLEGISEKAGTVMIEPSARSSKLIFPDKTPSVVNCPNKIRPPLLP